MILAIAIVVFVYFLIYIDISDSEMRRSKKIAEKLKESLIIENEKEGKNDLISSIITNENL